MPNFQELYDAAIANDDAAIKKLLVKGVSIDMRDDSEDFTTVAGKLVLNGHTDVAFRLINQFGAGPEYVVHALQKSGSHRLAQILVSNFEIDLNGRHFKDMVENNLIYGEVARNNKARRHNMEIFAHAGDLESIEYYNSSARRQQETFRHLTMWRDNYSLSVNIHHTIIENAAHGGHLKLLEKFYAKHKSLFNDNVVIGYNTVGCYWDCQFGNNSFRFVNAKLALHSLSFINDDNFRAVLVALIKKYGVIDYDIDAVNQKAKLVHDAMQSHNLHYTEAVDQVKLVLRAILSDNSHPCLLSQPNIRPSL